MGMKLHIVSEAERCLNCKRPLCRTGCPVQTSIPQAISLFRDNRIMEAGAMLFANNPMSLVCAIVCNHEAQCTGHCILGKKGSPVQFFDIEKYISEAYLDRMACHPVEKNGMKVAVIGSGPAGMTVAFILAGYGYEVTIFEAKDRIGGMLQYGIPEFRLPKMIIEKYQQRLVEMGVHIRPNTTIGSPLVIDDFLRDDYRSVFIGTGVWKPRTLHLEGESLANVHYGIDYLSNPSVYRLGWTVAVIGMGNVAMDVARTAFRHGARRVILYARSKKIAASEHEMMYARLDGAEFVFGMAIQRFTEAGPVFRVAIFDEEGRVTGYEEEPAFTQADSTIIAVSQEPHHKLVRTTDGLAVGPKGLLAVDENNMTSVAGVFAAGDVVHGAMTVVHAVEEAKKAAAAMMDFMDKACVLPHAVKA